MRRPMRPRGRPLSRSETEPVLAPFDAARPLPGRAFYDEDVFAFEEDAILGRSWHCVGREEDVALPGQWLRARVAGEALLLVRGADLELRGFHDVCRHRGASLAAGAECGRAARLECPYHGWTYELDGRLVRAPFAPAGSSRDELALVPAQTALWQGFVFVALDGTSPFAIGEAPPWLESAPIPTLRRGRRTSWDVLANWKLLVDNFQESHHFPRVHRELERLTPTERAFSWLPRSGPWLGGTMEIHEAETVSDGGSTRGRPRISEAGKVYDAMLFPTLFTSLQPDYLLTYRLEPLGASRTRVHADVLFHPAAFTGGFDPADVYAFWDRVNAEDRAICEEQQRNVRSRAFEPRYVTVEEGVHAFDRMIAEAHARAEAS